MRKQRKGSCGPPILPLREDAGGYEELLARAATCLGTGAVVLLPAEGLYGLHIYVPLDAGRLAIPQRIDRLRAIKGDPPNRPYIHLIGSPALVTRLTGELPPRAAELIAQAWPGPLTLIFPAAADLHPDLVKEGRVAVRCPGSLLLRDLALRLPGPFLSTSANRAGGAAPAALDEVAPEILQACGLAIDHGRLAGRGSTVAALGPDGRLEILRPGLWQPPDQGWTRPS